MDIFKWPPLDIVIRVGMVVPGNWLLTRTHVHGWHSNEVSGIGHEQAARQTGKWALKWHFCALSSSSSSSPSPSPEANKNNDDDDDDDDETGELEYLDTIEHLNMWRPMLNKRSETTPTTQKKWKESSKFGCKSLRNSLLSGRAVRKKMEKNKWEIWIESIDDHKISVDQVDDRSIRHSILIDARRSLA
ncbi:hypothetical protein BLOT_007746 [Blomia tropicalis]|nr:hypothetical protein BLOT_007746 [Blomia tropicalis]